MKLWLVIDKVLDFWDRCVMKDVIVHVEEARTECVWADRATPGASDGACYLSRGQLVVV